MGLLQNLQKKKMELIIGMESIIRRCNNYKNTTSSQILRELETSLLSSGFNDEIPSFLESFCNEDDAVKRFAAYDILVLFCRTMDITRCLTVKNLSRIIQEINYETPLETAAAVQVIHDMVKIPKFSNVLKECDGVAASLQKEYDFLVEIQFDSAQADDVYIVSIVKLISILKPQEILKIENFDKFSDTLSKVYLESIAFILSTSNFQKNDVKLSKPAIIALIREYLNHPSKEAHITAAIRCASHLNLSEFETMKTRFYDLCRSPIQAVRLAALEGAALTLTTTDNGVKSFLRISGFLDWLLERSTESEKACGELKLIIAQNVEICIKNKVLELDPRICLKIKSFIKDGAFYDSTRPEPQVMMDRGQAS